MLFWVCFTFTFNFLVPVFITNEKNILVMYQHVRTKLRLFSLSVPSSNTHESVHTLFFRYNLCLKCSQLPPEMIAQKTIPPIDHILPNWFDTRKHPPRQPLPASLSVWCQSSDGKLSSTVRAKASEPSFSLPSAAPSPLSRGSEPNSSLFHQTKIMLIPHTHTRIHLLKSSHPFCVPQKHPKKSTSHTTA